MGPIIAVIVVLLIMLLCLPVVFLAIYALRSFAIWRLAKQTEACNPNYAWIPVVQSYVLGKCAEACESASQSKRYSWGKWMLIGNIAHLSAVLVVLPIGILLALFGGGILLDAVSLVAIAYTVLGLVCTYKIYHYYIGDPFDIILTLLHMQYGYGNLGLLVVSFIKPRGQKISTYTAEFTDNDESVVIDAE